MNAPSCRTSDLVVSGYRRPPRAVAAFLLAIAVGSLLNLAGCSRMAVWMAPDKRPSESSTTLAQEATNQLRTALYAHRYEDLPAVTEALTRAYVENPREPKVALYLALAHLWTVSERNRLEQPPARITDSLILAERYFMEAGRLDPQDGRIPGWLAATRAALGDVHQDEKLQRMAYYDLRDAARTYPEFNEFVLGLVLSNLQRNHPKFPETVDAFWRNLDVCVGKKVDRTHPDLRPYLSRATDTGPKRVCWNTAAVPHNLEGFLLAMGDALVKNGQPDVAISVFRNLRELPSYAQWQYRNVVDQRIETAHTWASVFANEADARKHPQQFPSSAISCTSCHGA